MLVLVLTLAACSGDTDATVDTATTSTTSTNPTPETTTTQPAEPTTTTRALVGVSADFTRTVIELDGMALAVAVADTDEERVRGLMGVEDLHPLDGMLFVFDGAAIRSFWMKDTLIPLDIAFFDSNGVFVTKTTMEPCLEDDCPRYSSERDTQYALEAPVGALEHVEEGSRIVLFDALGGSGKEI